MTMGRRISQAATLILWGFALIRTSSVSANTSIETQPIRRVSDRQVRGSRRDLGIGSLSERKAGKESKGTGKSSKAESSKAEERTVDKPRTPKGTRNAPKLPRVERPLPKVFGNIALKTSRLKTSNLKTSTLKGSTNKLFIEPEKQQNQNANIVVNKEGIEEGVEEGVEPKPDGTEHFQLVDVEVYRREVPSFSIQFQTNSPSCGDPTLGDYDELSDVSEEYLDGFLGSVFEDVPVRHQGTVLFLMVNEEDPCTVDFKMTLEFVIPGEVPTINFLIEQLQEGLETETSKAFFISKLSTMSETNAFSKTNTYTVVSRPPMSTAEAITSGPGYSPQSGSVQSKNKKSILVSVLVGVGCVVLIGAGLIWKRKSNQGSVTGSTEPFSLFDKSNQKGKQNSPKPAGAYGADEETVSYLNSLRKRYKDNDVNEKSSHSRGNMAAVEQTGSYDECEDSMCDTVDTVSDHEKKGINFLNVEEC